MVLYSRKEKYSQKVLKTADELRENQQLCDIVLIVGYEMVHAHRNILVAGSDYFRTLFLGPFNESSKTEVDLSSTTSDFPTFQKCIKFLYTGEIDIDNDNLENLMKMSSCFLIHELQMFCSKFVKENLKLSTALRFYIFSKTYGYVKLETEIKDIVKSRFHDFFIFQEETLQISPEQLNQLFSDDFLDFCSWDMMLKFLSEWISEGFTDQHLEVVKNILETIQLEFIDTDNKLDLCEAKGQFFVVKAALEKLSTQVKSDRGSDGKFIVRKCQQLLKCCADQDATYFLTQGFCKVKSRLQSEGKLLPNVEDSVEDVLITISPRQSVIDAVNELRQSNVDHDEALQFDKFVGPVLDVCSYSLRTREWYYLYSVNDEMAANSLIRSNTFFPKLWEFASVGNRIFCATQNETHKSTAYELKLEDFSVKWAEYPPDGMPNGFKPEWTRLLVGKENVYSLSLDTEITQGNFIKCRKFNSNTMDPHGLQTLFSVQRQEGMAYSHVASLSPDCSEMLIVVGDKRAEGAFIVANPLEPNSAKVSVFRMQEKFKGKPKIHCWLKIVKGRDKFHVIEITKVSNMSNGQRQFEISCKYVYEYGSLLLKYKDSTLTVRDNTLHQRRPISTDPLLYQEHVFQDKGGSLFIFSGNSRETSSFYEIYETRKGNLDVREHTPPPFPYILGAFSAELSHGFLANKSRVTKYLLPA